MWYLHSNHGKGTWCWQGQCLAVLSASVFCIGSACQLFFHFFFPLFSLSHLMKRSEQGPSASQGSHYECMVQYYVMISIHINMKHQHQMVKTYIRVETKTLAKNEIEKKPRDTLLTELVVQWVIANKSTIYSGSLFHSWNWKQNLEIAFPWQHTKNWLLLQGFKVLGSLVVLLTLKRP